MVVLGDYFNILLRMPRLKTLLSSLLRKASRGCNIKVSLAGIPHKLNISLIEVIMVIMVGQFRSCYRVQVVGLQILWILIARY